MLYKPTQNIFCVDLFIPIIGIICTTSKSGYTLKKLYPTALKYISELSKIDIFPPSYISPPLDFCENLLLTYFRHGELKFHYNNYRKKAKECHARNFGVYWDYIRITFFFCYRAGFINVRSCHFLPDTYLQCFYGKNDH